METNQTRIKARIAGREFANQLIGLINDEVLLHVGYGADFVEALLEEIATTDSLPKKEASKPKVEELCPIARLGKTTMEYGEFWGKAYDDVPLNRLEWYLGVAEDNVRMLKSYLTHPDIASHRAACGVD